MMSLVGTLATTAVENKTVAKRRREFDGFYQG
jgi:hypothetical protein